MKSDQQIDSEESESFSELVCRTLSQDAHGVAQLDEICERLKGIKNTKKRLQIISNNCTCSPITFEEVAGAVWPAQSDRDINKFCLLQGDIVETTMVQRWGVARSDVDATEMRWVVLSTTCELVDRPNNSGAIRVAPAYPIKASYRDHADANLSALYKHLNSVSTLGSKKGFPYPAVEGDDADVIGYYCDFEQIGKIDRDQIMFATCIA